MNVGEPAVGAIVVVGQRFLVQPEQVQSATAASNEEALTGQLKSVEDGHGVSLRGAENLLMPIEVGTMSAERGASERP